MPGKTCERELQHDLAGALRPVMASLGFFQTLQFATDINEHLGKLRANRIERPHDALLGCDDLVAQRRRVERSPSPRSAGVPHLRHDGRCRIGLLPQGELPRLIALWPHELADQSPEGILLILSKLRRALSAERRRGLAGHWSYELNRHLGLMTAYKAELGLMRRAKLRLRRTVPGAARSTSAAEAPNEDAKLARRPGEPAR